jgi:GR25 family glycosyltransferase involved in LPS biosynthesis
VKDTPDRPTLAYVIGLIDGYRGAPLDAQLGALGITPQFVPGVKVEDRSEDFEVLVDQAAAKVLQRRPLTKPEVGCALAHRSAWTRLLDTDNDFALIFEDDARLLNDPRSDSLTALLQSDKPRLVLFDTYSDYAVVRRQSQAGPYVQALLPMLGTWAYGVNRSAAELLLERGEPIRSVTDWPARVSHRIQFFLSYPQIAEVDAAMESSIESGRESFTRGRTETRARKIARMALTFSHINWLRYRRIYGSYGAYFQHELLRLPVAAAARHRNRRFNPSDPRSPLTL